MSSSHITSVDDGVGTGGQTKDKDPKILRCILSKVFGGGGLNKNWGLADELFVRLFRSPSDVTNMAEQAAAQKKAVERVTKMMLFLYGKFITPVTISSAQHPHEDHEAYWIHSGNANEEADAVLLYIHGGGYVQGNPLQFLSIYRTLIQECRKVHRKNLKILAIKYPLAPEAQYPQQRDTVVEIYSWLLQKCGHAKVYIGGDSAGGNCTLAAALRIKELQIPSPSGLLTISPWVNLEHTSASFEHNDPYDIVDMYILTTFAAYFRGDKSSTHPEISPLFADLSGLPPTLVTYGGREVMFDDLMNFIEKLRSSHVDVTVVGDEHMYHVYPICLPVLRSRAAKDALTEFCNFIVKYAAKSEECGGSAKITIKNVEDLNFEASIGA